MLKCLAHYGCFFGAAPIASLRLRRYMYAHSVRNIGISYMPNAVLRCVVGSVALVAWYILRVECGDSGGYDHWKIVMLMQCLELRCKG